MHRSEGGHHDHQHHAVPEPEGQDVHVVLEGAAEVSKVDAEDRAEVRIKITQP